MIQINIEQIYIFLEIDASVEIKMDTSRDAETALNLYKELNEGIRDLNVLKSSIDGFEEEAGLQEVLLSDMSEKFRSNVNVETKIEEALQEAKNASKKAKEEARKSRKKLGIEEGHSRISPDRIRKKNERRQDDRRRNRNTQRRASRFGSHFHRRRRRRRRGVFLRL